MKRVFSRIHTIIAFPVGLIVTILCLSGAILVFRAEIEEAMRPERYFIDRHTSDTAGSPLPIDELIRLAGEQLSDDTVTGITVSSDQRRNYAVSVTSDFHRLHYINPYTGKLILTGGAPTFFTAIFRLHRWLLLNPQTGRPITGWSTALFVAALVTGAVIVVPKTRKELVRILSISILKGRQRFWYDLHISAGTYALILLLVLSLTGLTWSFPWYTRGLYSLFGIELSSMSRPSQSSQPARNRGDAGEHKIDVTRWSTVLEAIKAENPNYKTIAIRNGAVTVVQNCLCGNSRASDRYAFDLSTGEITTREPYAMQGKAVKLRGWLYTLHVGSWCGFFSKILTAMASLIGASLPLTGYYILWKRNRRKK
jgi:uncharacterized iron-regulated membrane protein